MSKLIIIVLCTVIFGSAAYCKKLTNGCKEKQKLQTLSAVLKHVVKFVKDDVQTAALSQSDAIKNACLTNTASSTIESSSFCDQRQLNDMLSKFNKCLDDHLATAYNIIHTILQRPTLEYHPYRGSTKKQRFSLDPAENIVKAITQFIDFPTYIRRIGRMKIQDVVMNFVLNIMECKENYIPDIQWFLDNFLAFFENKIYLCDP